MIILTAAQAAQVEGETIPGERLEPIPLENGMFMLPEEILDDPAHARKFATLDALPKRKVNWNEVTWMARKKVDIEDPKSTGFIVERPRKPVEVIKGRP